MYYFTQFNWLCATFGTKYLDIIPLLNIKTFLCRRPARIDLRHLSEKVFKLQPPMVRCSVLLVTSNNILYLLGDQLQYSIEMNGFIVSEFIQFIDIPDKFEEIVTSFDRRLKNTEIGWNVFEQRSWRPKGRMRRRGK